MFFRKKLKKSTPESERAFAEMLKEEGVGFKDKLAMILSAFLMLVLPSILILVGLSLLMMWIFGIL